MSQTEQDYRDAVYAKAEAVKTPNDFVALIKELERDEFDYGRIVYACAAAAIAGFNVMNRTNNGGITGFQAGCLMWEMVHKFGSFGAGPLRIQDFDNLRYPQYDHDWGVTLSSEAAQQIIDRAVQALKSNDKLMSPDVSKRNKEIAEGQFPDFVEVTL